MTQLELVIKIVSRCSMPKLSREQLKLLGYTDKELNRWEKNGFYPRDEELKSIAEKILMEYLK